MHSHNYVRGRDWTGYNEKTASWFAATGIVCSIHDFPEFKNGDS